MGMELWRVYNKQGVGRGFVGSKNCIILHALNCVRLLNYWTGLPIAIFCTYIQFF